MLIDLLNSTNYIMVNIDSIQILGLNASVYCAELLNIYKKAYKKKKIDEDNFFTVDRTYISNRTSLSTEDQLKSDIKLADVGILTRHPENVDMVKFNVEKYASLLASEDVQLTDQVKEKMNKSKVAGITSAKKQAQIQQLKSSIECRTPEVLCKLYDWIETVFETKALSKAQVKLFKDKLDDYCNGDLKKAIAILDLAIVHAYTDCAWAINLYERGNKMPEKQASQRNVNVRVTPEKRTIQFSEDIF